MTECVHSWEFIGELHQGDERRRSIVCYRPNLIRCRVPECARELVVKCGTARTERCEPCGTAHRGRVGIVAASGPRGAVPFEVKHKHKGERRARRVSTVGLFLTVSAPGTREHNVGRSGRLCRCTPRGGQDVGRWNARSGKSFNRLMMALRRELGDDLEYFKAAEAQKRGALHFHLIIRRRDGGPVALSTARLRQLAMDYGFGHEVDVQPVQQHHFGYVAKYAAKAADARQDVPWQGTRRKVETVLNFETGELVPVTRIVPSLRPTYRTWTASRQWGEKMKHVRMAQGHFNDCLRALPDWREQPTRPAWAVAVPARPEVPADPLGTS